MAQQIFLIAPESGDAEAVLPAFRSALAATPIAALFLPIGERDENEYTNLVKDLMPTAQNAACAVILDNRPGLVGTLGADGVHMSSGIRALRKALDALKPDYIVGTGDLGSRHEAMLRGELEVDYLMFGDREDSDAEMAQWWAETFEIPSVYLASALDDPNVQATGSEFIGFRASDWMDPDAPAKLAQFQT